MMTSASDLSTRAKELLRRLRGKTLPILLADLVDKWDGRSVIWLRSKEHIDALMRGINPPKAPRGEIVPQVN